MLFWIASELFKTLRHPVGIDKQKYEDEKIATESFEQDIDLVFRKNGTKRILIIFDEIEHISPETSSEQMWQKGTEFIHFWRAMRSTFQHRKHVFSYLIVGTNPMCTELPTICGFDNPIFMQIPLDYVEPFTRADVHEMIDTLGGFVGLKFDERVCSKLTEDYGGHPFLIRLVCSMIYNECKHGDRPMTIDPVMYQTAKKRFSGTSQKYFSMMLDVIEKYYKEEYDMLHYLANNEMSNFNSIAREFPIFTNHLLGYGIIAENAGNYFFKIDGIKEFLIQKHQYQSTNLTKEQKLAEISSRRNPLEENLRRIVRQTLLTSCGKEKARELVIKKLKKPDRFATLSYSDLFDPNKSEIYFKTLRDIVISSWEFFKNIFGENQENFDQAMHFLNKFRPDAHAKDIDDNDFQLFRHHCKWLEGQCDSFLNG